MANVEALHGREIERRRVDDLLEKVSHGVPELMVVDGQSGIGKSRLLTDAARRAHRQGFIVHHYPASEFMRLASSDLPRRIGESSRPTLLVLDDLVLDEAEPTPASALHTVIRDARKAPSSPVGMLFARSATGRSMEVDRLAEEAGVPADRMELAPLNNPAVLALVSDIIGGNPRPGLLDVAACASGNPRLIVELIEGLAEEGRIGPQGDLIRLAPGRLPTRTKTAVASLLRRLSGESVRLLRVGTVLGHTFQLSHAAAILDTSSAALLLALDETLAAGILALTDDAITFQQAVVWRAIYESIPAQVLASLHRDAQRLASDGRVPVAPVPGGRPAAMLDQALGSGVVGAARTLLRAGHLESVALLAGSALTPNEAPPSRESWLLECVVQDLLTLEAPRDGDVAATATALSNLEWREGNVIEALRWGREAVHEVDPARTSYPLLALVWKLAALGEIDDAETSIRQASTGARAAGFDLAVDLVRADLRLRTGSLDLAREQADRVLSDASRTGLPSLVAWASSTLCLIALRAGDTGVAARHLERCQDTVHVAMPFSTVRHRWLEFLLQAARDGTDGAAGLLATTRAEPPFLRQLLLEEPGAAAWFVRLARAVDDRSLADPVLRAVERLSADNPGVAAIALAATHARSLYECDAAGLARAAAGHRDAWAKSCAGDDFRALLTERQVDLGPWLSPSAGPGVPWDALTETERAIATLVADGLTNRQVAKEVFLSPHTVNYYLRRIYGKLGIHSRIELARYFPRRGVA